MKKYTNNLKPENCNKAMCVSCIFREDGSALELNPGRLDEIKHFLAIARQSHICHTTNKTCYGALTFQATIFYRMKLIPEDSVESLLETAGKYIG